MAEKLYQNSGEIIINTPIETVFSYTINPVDQVEWMPSLIEIKDLEEKEDGLEWNYRYKLMSLPLEGRSKQIELIPNEKSVVSGLKGVKNTWTFLFEPVGLGTRVKVTVEYEIPSALLKQLAGGFIQRANENILKASLENLKARLEG